jgi:hypothetical protein
MDDDDDDYALFFAKHLSECRYPDSFNALHRP